MCAHVPTIFLIKQVDLVDESRTLDDHNPFGKFLKVIKKKADKEQQIINAHFTYLIGKGTTYAILLSNAALYVLYLSSH